MTVLEKRQRVEQTERRIKEYILDGYDGAQAIAKAIGISKRTVKAYLNRMYNERGIRDGVKIVKLTVQLYRESLGQQVSC